MESILISIKKLLGITEEYEHFDTDIIIHINSVFLILNQIGIGPSEGFSIANTMTVWDEYIQDDPNLLEAVKTYVYLKVRLIFDPPSSSAHVQSIEKLIQEYEWRLNLQAETKKPVEED